MRIRAVLAVALAILTVLVPLDVSLAAGAPGTDPPGHAFGRSDPDVSNQSVHSAEAVWDFSDSVTYQTSLVTLATGKLNLTTEPNNTGNRWERLADMAAGEQREDFSAAWDNSSGQMLVHGGYTDGGMMGPNWSQSFTTYIPAVDSWSRQANGALPAGNVGVWDPVDGLFITHGGYYAFQDYNVSNPPVTGYVCSNSTYVWSNHAWVNCSPGPERYHHSAVWDPLHGIMLVFGGADTIKEGDVYNTTYYNDLWRYNFTNDTWTKLAPPGTLPPARANHTAVWDTRVGQMIVFGGSNATTAAMNDTWTYNYTTNRWTKKPVVVTVPTARYQHAACWNPDDKVMILTCGIDAAGNYLNDTYVYNATGNCWTKMAALPAGPRAALAAVYDAIDGKMLICGGRAADLTQLNETWSFKYMDWVMKCMPAGSAQAKAFSLGDRFLGIDRVSWYGTSPPGANVTLRFRASNGNINTAAFSVIENGSKPQIQGRNIQWNITLEPSGDRLAGPEIGMVRVEYTVNSIPVVTAGPPVQAKKRSTVILNCTAADADDDPLAYNWTQVSGPNATLSAADIPEPDFSPQKSGAYVFQITVNDSLSVSAPANITVVVQNSPPVAYAGPNQTGFKNETVTLQGGATDTDGDELTYEWTQVMGTTVTMNDTGGSTLKIVPPSPGNYTFELVASDGESRSEPSRVGVQVAGRPPIAVLAASQSVVRLDQSVDLSANGSSDPDGRVSRYFFDFGDGRDSGWTMRPAINHTYGLPGTFNATLKVQDADGVYSEQSPPVKITVYNAPPEVDAKVTPESGNTSTQFRFSTIIESTFDPDGSIVSYAWDFGDGGHGSGSPTYHVYKKRGDYEVKLRVTDDMGAYADWSTNLSVMNRPPGVNSWMPPSSTAMTVGEQLTFSCSALDPENDPMTYSWTLDGEPQLGDLSSFVYTPMEKGGHVVELTISDGANTTVLRWAVTVNARPAPAKPGGSELPLVPIIALIVIAACAVGGYAAWRRGKGGKKAEPAAGPAEAGTVVIQSQNASPPPGTRPASAYEIPDIGGYHLGPSTAYPQFQGPAAYQEPQPAAAYPGPAQAHPEQASPADEPIPMAVPVEDASGAAPDAGEVREATPIDDDEGKG